MNRFPARLAAALLACASPAFASETAGPPDMSTGPKPYAPAVRRATETRMWIAHGLDAADAATTCMAIARGGEERNPILRAVIGKRPSCGEVVAAKLATAAVRHLIVGRAIRKGSDPERVRIGQWVGIAGIGLTVTWNFTQLAR